MAMNFESALNFVLRWEGESLVDDPRDPGGLTKYGISQRAYPNLDIATLTRSQAGDIYRRDYWQPCGCTQWANSLALLVFDSAVNQGVGGAIRLLQQAVSVNADGIIGPVTRAAVRTALPMSLLDEFAARRMASYAQTRGFDTYGLGWSRRLMAAHSQAVLTP